MNWLLKTWAKKIWAKVTWNEPQDETKESSWTKVWADWNTYKIAEEESWLSWFKDWIAEWVVWLASKFLSKDKQDVDRALYWLKKDWVSQNTDGLRAEYLNTLNEYNTLKANEDTLTPTQLQLLKDDKEELDKYTVADRPHWVRSTILNLIVPDSIREDNFQSNKYWATKVDTNYITENLTPNVKKLFGIQDPNLKAQTTGWSWIETITQDEFNRIFSNVNTKKLVEKKANQMIKNLYIASRNPWGRESTLDETLWDLESAFQDRAIALTFESLDQLMANIGDDSDYRNLRNYLMKQKGSYINMVWDILETHDQSKESIAKIITQNWNPLRLNLDKLLKSKTLTNKERTLINLVNTIWSTGEDTYYTTNQLIWAKKVLDHWGNVVNSSSIPELLKEWTLAEVNTLPYASAILWGKVSSLAWQVAWTTEATAQWLSSLWDKSWNTNMPTLDDINAYFYGAQNSSIFDLKQRVHPVYQQMPWYAKVGNYIWNKESVIDDLITAFIEAKAVDLPVKTAELKNLWTVISKWSKIDKLAKNTEKVASAWEKLADAGEKIITEQEKIKWLVDSWTYFKRVSDATKRFFKWIAERRKDAKEWLKNLTTKDKRELRLENLWRWLAEEALTSATFQWMTPYDYQYSDLVMDIFWWMFSGWIRAKQFNNSLWLTKLQSQDAGWVTWWYRDVYKDPKTWKGLSDAEVKDKMSKMSLQDIKELWTKIREETWLIADETQYVTKWQFTSKVQAMSDIARKAIDDFGEKLIKDNDEALKLKFNKSVDPSVNRLVRSKYTKWPDGKTTKTLEWNLKKDATPKEEKAFWNKVSNARTKLYWWETLDNFTNLSNVKKLIEAQRKYVKNNTLKLAVKKYKDKYSKAWRIEQDVKDHKRHFTPAGKENIKKIREDLLKNRLIRLNLYKYDLLNAPKTKETFMGKWPIDEAGDGWMSRHLARYVNNFIENKYLNKWALYEWLKLMWPTVFNTFQYFLKERFKNKTIADISYKELVSAIKEFWRAYDAKLVSEARANHVADFVLNWPKDESNWLIYKSFEDAKDPAKWWNPDLKYMWINLYEDIINDINVWLTKEEAEMKLRNWRRVDKNWNILAIEWDLDWKIWKGSHIYGIDDSGKWTKERALGRNVFNDTYEEKKIFGNEWEIYLKVNKEDWNAIVKVHADKDHIITPFNRNEEWVIKATYERQWVDTSDGTVVYHVYDSNEIHIATITTTADVDFSKLKKYWWKYLPEDIYPNSRVLSIQLLWDLAWSWKSVDFEVVKWKTELKVFNTDLDKTFRNDTVVTRDTIRTWQEIAERTTTWEQWSNFSIYIRKWQTSYAGFRELIPGYTDRVPESYFNYVMRDKTLSPVDKQNLLTAMMTNRRINITNDWIAIDLQREDVFRIPSYKVKTPIFDKQWKYEWKVDQYKFWDSKVFKETHPQGTVLFTREDGTVEAFHYETTDGWIYNLYRANDPKPVGVISIGDTKVKAYLTDSKTRQYAKRVEFLDDADIERGNKIIEDRYYEVKVKVDVPDEDIYYKEIYKELYGVEMPADMYHKLRSTPGMTPERYLNNKIDEFRNDKFWRYIPIRSWSWRDVAKQLGVGEDYVSRAKNYINQYPDTQLTDAQIIRTIDRIKNPDSWKFTPSELEIKNIMYWENKVITNDNDLINIYWYSMFWKEPQRLEDAKIKRLRNRRDNILLALYKDEKILDMSDWEKELLVDWAKRKWLMDWTEEQLLQDVLDHPEIYKGILKALSKSIIEMEKLTDTAADLKRIWELNNKLWELERKWALKKYKKKTTKATSQIQEKISEYQKSEVDNLLAQAQEEINKASFEWDEAWRKAAYSKKYELEQYDRRREEEFAYKNQRKLWDLTEEEFDALAKAKASWNEVWVMNERPLSQREVTARINDISRRLPSQRIIEVDRRTWEIRTRWFTEQEQIIYKEQIDAAAQDIMSWRANAAHVRELHAIVINPDLVLSWTLWHEWFHEAISLMHDKKWTKKRIADLYENTYYRHKDQIESFASSRWYDEIYAELRAEDEKAYQTQITEEWLAERFWEYVNNRYNEALWLSNDVIAFFNDLWEKMKLLFSDTNAMELFEDIYEWRVDYWDITIDLNASNAWLDYSLLSPEAKDFFERYDPAKNSLRFWDTFSDATLSILKQYEWMSDKDLKVWTSRSLVWRWAFLWEIKSDFADGTRASFNDLYEAINKSSVMKSAEDLNQYVYGWGLVSDFSWMTQDVLLELRDTWKIVREWNNFTVTFSTQPFYPESQTVLTNREFSFDIDLWNSNVYSVKSSDIITDEEFQKNITMIWKDWYEYVMKKIWDRLNDSEATKSKSRNEFNHNLFSQINKFNQWNKIQWDLINALNPNLNKMTDALENWIRRWYDQVELAEYKNVDPEVKELVKEAFYVYLFNQYIPHAKWWDDVIQNALFKRKADLSIELARRIDELNNKSITWEIEPLTVLVDGKEKDVLNPIFTVVVDLWDWQKRRIGRHLLDLRNRIDAPRELKITQLFDDAYVDVDAHRVVNNNPTYLWRQSPLSVTSEEFLKEIKKYEWRAQKAIQDWTKMEWTYSFWRNMRNKLESARPSAFKWQDISYSRVAVIDLNKVSINEKLWLDLSDAEIKELYKNWELNPVTIISAQRHAENVKYINDIHRKYDISISNASPDFLEELKKMKEANWWSLDTRVDKAKHRQLRAEYQRTMTERNDAINEMDRKNTQMENFKQWKIYQQYIRLQNILETNWEAYKKVQDADENTIIKDTSDVNSTQLPLAEEPVTELQDVDYKVIESLEDLDDQIEELDSDLNILRTEYYEMTQWDTLWILEWDYEGNIAAFDSRKAELERIIKEKEDILDELEERQQALKDWRVEEEYEVVEPKEKVDVDDYDFLKEINKDHEWIALDEDIPNWENCSIENLYNALDNPRMAMYRDDIEYALWKLGEKYEYSKAMSSEQYSNLDKQYRKEILKLEEDVRNWKISDTYAEWLRDDIRRRMYNDYNPWEDTSFDFAEWERNKYDDLMNWTERKFSMPRWTKADNDKLLKLMWLDPKKDYVNVNVSLERISQSKDINKKISSLEKKKEKLTTKMSKAKSLKTLNKWKDQLNTIDDELLKAKIEAAGQLPKWSIEQAISEISDLDVRIATAQWHIDYINEKLSSISWKKRTDDMIEKRNRLEYIIEKANNDKRILEDEAYTKEWEESIWTTSNILSIVCEK